MQTGENAQSLRQILDFIRFGSIFLLLIHYYSVCYPAIVELKLNVEIVNKVCYKLASNFSFLGGVHKPKITILIFLAISLFGIKGKKNEKLTSHLITLYLVIGLLFFFASTFLLDIQFPPTNVAGMYVGVTSVGYILILTGATKASRLLRLKNKNDVFNDLNETFPQTEERIENEYSLNFEMEYSLKGKIRKGYINFINIFRGTICAGTPGSGKSFYFFREVLSQLTSKGFTFCLYDLKFPDLSIILYNHVRKNLHKYPVAPKFYIINFDNLAITHQCNVLYPESMLDLSDATESSRTLLLALNSDWKKKQGDFFTESAINFTTALFWFLRKYENGRYCSLPHAIELSTVDYDKLFPVLSMEKSIDVLLNPFISAYLRSATDQLEGQIASAKIALARLVSPNLYYVLSGSDFTLDINNPTDPKILCLGSNPAKQATYGAVISLYLERMHKLINKKGQRPCALVYDEFASLTSNVDYLISTARSNLVAVFLGLQDMSQLTRDYGKEMAEVIVNVCGNIISGQVLGESAKTLSERIGKVNQDKESLSINANDTSLSKSTQLDNAVPISRISNLSSGEFVGTVSDTPTQQIKKKPSIAALLTIHKPLKKKSRNMNNFQQFEILTSTL
ncbi:YWFCY domain-containing protein [Paraflavitalea sp. CAU 1676]|uniref:YWFCY domain-containing protein n=1 Tax=Paraflavitalea sp. CAU 1676 TaxID=3032598 RepID=UPI0023DB97AA|nr:YWFCY domain-containing protein [Paraflavitalea sp. CAU 1676]MDF2190548.1 YWFCY domain-containing protein [Paraflavitalea sp. CAU 1676]